MPKNSVEEQQEKMALAGKQKPVVGDHINVNGERELYVPDTSYGRNVLRGKKSDYKNKPLFPNGGPKRSDVVQSNDLACFLLAPAATIANADPDYIKNMMHDNGDGTVTVRLYASDVASARKKGLLPEQAEKVPYNIRVDKTPMTIDSGSRLWVSLLEKAYTAFGPTTFFGSLPDADTQSQRIKDGGLNPNIDINGGSPQLTINSFTPDKADTKIDAEQQKVAESEDITTDGYQKFADALVNASNNGQPIYMDTGAHVVSVDSVVWDNGTKDYSVKFYDQLNSRAGLQTMPLKKVFDGTGRINYLPVDRIHFNTVDSKEHSVTDMQTFHVGKKDLFRNFYKTKSKATFDSLSEDEKSGLTEFADLFREVKGIPRCTLPVDYEADLSDLSSVKDKKEFIEKTRKDLLDHNIHAEFKGKPIFPFPEGEVRTNLVYENLVPRLQRYRDIYTKGSYNEQFETGLSEEMRELVTKYDPELAAEYLVAHIEKMQKETLSKLDEDVKVAEQTEIEEARKREEEEARKREEEEARKREEEAQLQKAIEESNKIHEEEDARKQEEEAQLQKAIEESLKDTKEVSSENTNVPQNNSEQENKFEENEIIPDYDFDPNFQLSSDNDTLENDEEKINIPEQEIKEEVPQQVETPIEEMPIDEEMQQKIASFEEYINTQNSLSNDTPENNEEKINIPEQENVPEDLNNPQNSQNNEQVFPSFEPDNQNNLPDFSNIVLDDQEIVPENQNNKIPQVNSKEELEALRKSLTEDNVKNPDHVVQNRELFLQVSGEFKKAHPQEKKKTPKIEKKPKKELSPEVKAKREEERKNRAAAIQNQRDWDAQIHEEDEKQQQQNLEYIQQMQSQWDAEDRGIPQQQNEVRQPEPIRQEEIREEPKIPEKENNINVPQNNMEENDSDIQKAIEESNKTYEEEVARKQKEEEEFQKAIEESLKDTKEVPPEDINVPQNNSEQENKFEENEIIPDYDFDPNFQLSSDNDTPESNEEEINIPEQENKPAQENKFEENEIEKKSAEELIADISQKLNLVEGPDKDILKNLDLDTLRAMSATKMEDLIEGWKDRLKYAHENMAKQENLPDDLNNPPDDLNNPQNNQNDLPDFSTFDPYNQNNEPVFPELDPELQNNLPNNLGNGGQENISPKEMPQGMPQPEFNENPQAGMPKMEPPAVEPVEREPSDVFMALMNIEAVKRITYAQPEGYEFPPDMPLKEKFAEGLKWLQDDSRRFSKLQGKDREKMLSALNENVEKWKADGHIWMTENDNNKDVITAEWLYDEISNFQTRLERMYGEELGVQVKEEAPEEKVQSSEEPEVQYSLGNPYGEPQNIEVQQLKPIQQSQVQQNEVQQPEEKKAVQEAPKQPEPVPEDKEIYFATEYIVNGNNQFSFDPVFQMTNDLKYMTDVASQVENSDKYDQRTKDFVQAKVQAVRHLQKLKDNRAANKKEVGKVGENGFPVEYKNQTQGGGCWSVGIEDLLNSRGVKLPQEIVRSYRGNVDAGNAEFKSSVGKMKAGDTAELVGLDGTELPFRTSVITEVMPNVAVRTKDYQNFPANVLEGKIRESLNKAFGEHKSPVSVDTGGHYVTIHNYDPKTGKIWYKEPMYPPSENPVVTSVRQLAAKCASGGRISMTWLEDLNFNESKAIEGFGDYQYKNNELDGPEGPQSSVLSDSRVTCGKMLSKSSFDEKTFRSETTYLQLPDKLVELQPYQSIEPPTITGTQARSWGERGMKEIRERERQEREQHRKDLAEKANAKKNPEETKVVQEAPKQPAPKQEEFKLKSTPVEFSPVAQQQPVKGPESIPAGFLEEMYRLNGRLNLNTRAKDTMKKMRTDFADALDHISNLDHPPKISELREAMKSVMADGKQYQNEKLAQKGGFSKTQLLRLKTINYMAGLNYLAEKGISVNDSAGKEFMLAVKLANAITIVSKDKGPKGLCKSDEILSLANNLKGKQAFKEFINKNANDLDNLSKKKSLEFLKSYTASASMSSPNVKNDKNINLARKMDSNQHHKTV